MYRHSVSNFFYYYHSEILKGVILLSKVLVNGDRSIFFGVIPMLIYPFMGLLLLDFPHILSVVVAFVTESYIDGILRFAALSLSDIESLLPGLVGEEVC